MKTLDAKDYIDFAEKSRTGQYQKHKVHERYKIEFIYEPFYGGILKGKNAVQHAAAASQYIGDFHIIFAKNKEQVERRLLHVRKQGGKAVIIDTKDVTDNSSVWSHFFRFDTDKMEELTELVPKIFI